MTHMWWLWLKHRWRGLGALAVTAVIAGLLSLLALGGGVLDVQFLGNAFAPRAAGGGQAGTLLPRSTNPDAQPGTLPDPNASLLDAPLPDAVLPHSVAEAQAPWNADTVARYQRQVLAAVNCAREAKGLSALTPDPALTRQAGEAWLRLVREPSWSLADLPGHYTMRGVLPLELGDPGAGPTSGTGGARQDSPQCEAVGADVAALADTGDGTTIGIAVFPPQASWDLASAVVLVK
jgi:hypothetical protein